MQPLWSVLYPLSSQTSHTFAISFGACWDGSLIIDPEARRGCGVYPKKDQSDLQVNQLREAFICSSDGGTSTGKI